MLIFFNLEISLINERLRQISFVILLGRCNTRGCAELFLTAPTISKEKSWIFLTSSILYFRYCYIRERICFSSFYLNPFIPNVPFLYPLKTSENRKGVENGCIRNKWVNPFQANVPFLPTEKSCFWTFLEDIEIKLWPEMG